MTNNHPFVKELIRMLGLDDMRVRRLILDIQVDKPVIVTVEEFPAGGDVNPVTFQEFHLIPVEDSPAGADTDSDSND